MIPPRPRMISVVESSRKLRQSHSTFPTGVRIRIARCPMANVGTVEMPDLYGISTVPTFAIGQRAFLIRTPVGNVLWDCLSFLDDSTTEIIRGLGGIMAVAVSHPHFYSAMASWGRAFDCPVLA